MSTLPLFGPRTFAAIDPPRLRPYQSRAIQALRDRVREGKKRILLVAPTGAGKTVILASVIRTSTLPVLFVAHRMELIEQCVDQLARVGITNVGVIRGADARVNPDATVQVASIQTLARRDKPPAGIVILDEAHRAVSDSYLKLMEHYEDAIVLGFTATPTRHDNRPLGNMFECLEVVTTYEKLIKDGLIMAPICYSGPAQPDLSKVKTSKGDYDEAALGLVMNEGSLVGNLVSHWLKLAHMYPRADGGLPVEGPRRRTFVFAVNIDHSIAIRDKFTSAGIRIAHLDGTTPEKERRHILRAIGSGDIEVVTNVGVLLEGVDVPSVKCVVHARPTQSLVLWRQSTGRILRPWHPKRGEPSLSPLLLDHAGNIAQLGFPHEDMQWALTTKARPIERKQAVRICKSCFAYLPAFKQRCPYCGVEAPPAVERLPPTESNASLMQLASSPEEMRRMYFNMMVKQAREKGYKPGFASARYKERYGHWPPWAWSEQTKASFASDPQWQVNHENHQALKAKLAAIKKAKGKQ